MATADEKAADRIGRAIDGRIETLTKEREAFLPAAAATRIAEIDAELAALATEKARIDPRRPAKTTISSTVEI